LPLTYLQYKDIDKKKWDYCIRSSQHPLIYAYAFFLNGMSEKVAALIYNDYEAVMPLTFKRKAGISYLYQPAFLQQLGIFSKAELTEELKTLFLQEAKARFRFAEIFVNFNAGPEQPNYILPLNSSYDVISENYTTDLKKNLRHATRFNMAYQPGDDIEASVNLYKDLYGKKMPHVKQKDYDRLIKICIAANAMDHLLIRRVIGEDKKLLAVAVLLKDDHRLYNIMSAVTEAGRNSEANHYLFDEVIKEFSGQSLTLDFEGSSIEGIAHFYKKYGAVNEQYFFLRYNDLPGFVKLFKK
jgi:hypothetical protein